MELSHGVAMRHKGEVGKPSKRVQKRGCKERRRLTEHSRIRKRRKSAQLLMSDAGGKVVVHEKDIGWKVGRNGFVSDMFL